MELKTVPEVKTAIYIRNKEFNPNWKEGDPLESKDELRYVAMPEGATNAQILCTDRGYTLCYDEKEHRDDPELLHLKVKIERITHWEIFYDAQLNKDFVRVLRHDWTPLTDHSTLPADWKQPANSWS